MNNAEIIYEGNVPVNQDPPALDAAIVATSAPMTAKEALLQIRLERLRQELLVDFQDEEPDLIDLKVTVALEEAVEKFPHHDAAVKASVVPSGKLELFLQGFASYLVRQEPHLSKRNSGRPK